MTQVSLFLWREVKPGAEPPFHFQAGDAIETDRQDTTSLAIEPLCGDQGVSDHSAVKESGALCPQHRDQTGLYGARSGEFRENAKDRYRHSK